MGSIDCLSVNLLRCDFAHNMDTHPALRLVQESRQSSRGQWTSSKYGTCFRFGVRTELDCKVLGEQQATRDLKTYMLPPKLLLRQHVSNSSIIPRYREFNNISSPCLLIQATPTKDNAMRA
jgi:hypothetical protein